MSLLKSDLGEAKSASELLNQDNSVLEEHVILMSAETNIPAMDAAAAIYAQEEGSKSGYKEALSADAGNITSLGEEFAEFDKAIGQGMKLPMPAER